ncbi:Six-hairpin glycosidase-like protein [Colletotrichum phormii]|uniref:Six-hairpin glycosidase-like protein n=1 Tax=Colletotrichum phormii TaxID=359342 RepID=A0AAI9ZLB8_9PEZI|nr:Six-hairpin glycosidase-like protein [Colletotrichum phormii]KAK1633801.1 Six-hairpin glycosidase-like protein [Colletotrichum phormii]
MAASITPIAFLEIIPQDGPNIGHYDFFPGTLYTLLERSIKYPQIVGLADAGPGIKFVSLRQYLRGLYKELNSNEKSLASIVKATYSLTTRYIPAARAIRKSVSALAKNGYKGQLYSTYHVANIDPTTGNLKWRWTAQGYANDSTWARGQSWAILGAFLKAALGTAEYFLYRLDTAPSSPIQNPIEPLRDSSAGIITTNGMLVLSQELKGIQEHDLAQRFFDAAVDIVRDTLDYSLANKKAQFTRDSSKAGCFDGIIKYGTANNNENARRRY